MTAAYKIKWTNKEAGRHVDLLPVELFATDEPGREITHHIQRPNGSFYLARCSLYAKGNTATLTYSEDDRWWSGKTKLIFSNSRRQTINEVLWADEGSSVFRDLHAVLEKVDWEAQEEVARLKMLGTIARRPEQTIFSAKLREAYLGKCAVTGCATAQALQAAHIQVRKGVDNNDLKNGILLRADIHALFDVGLITLTEDGSQVEVNRKDLTDPSYQFLIGKAVYRPGYGGPSRENILHHRRRFCFGSGGTE
jgi:hypothetical protein